MPCFLHLGCQGCRYWLLPSIPPENMGKHLASPKIRLFAQWCMKLLCLISQDSLQAVVSLSCIALTCSVSEHHLNTEESNNIANFHSWVQLMIEQEDGINWKHGLEAENSHPSPITVLLVPCKSVLSLPPCCQHMGPPLCSASAWEQPHIAWARRFMLDFGGLSNHILFLQHLTILL